MLSDKQSLILCGLMIGGIFVCGILDILDNFITKTVLTIIFLVIVTNVFIVYSKSKKEEKNDLN